MGITPEAPEYAELREAFLDHYETCLAETTVLFAGVAELLDAIEQRGLKWGIVTNKFSRFKCLVATTSCTRLSCLKSTLFSRLLTRWKSIR